MASLWETLGRSHRQVECMHCTNVTFLLVVLMIVMLLSFESSSTVSRILLVPTLLHDSTGAVDSRKATGAVAGPRREVSYTIQIEDISGS